MATGAQTAKLTSSDTAKDDVFGSSVAFFGNTAIVGASGKDKDRGAAYLFDIRTCEQTAKLTADDAAEWNSFGSSVAIFGTTAIVGAIGNNSYHGAANLFDTTTGKQTAKLTASGTSGEDVFGISGPTVIVGAYKNNANGAAHILHQQ